MKILIIGGNRFFGKRLAQLFLQQGIDLTLLNRGKLDDGFGKNIKRIIMDRRILDSKHPDLNQKWDYVFDQVCYDSHEARSAIETFRDKTSNYVFTSTLSVYNPGADLKEDDFDSCHYKFNQDCNQKLNYGEAKRQAESLFIQQKYFKVTAVRLPYVLGPDDYTQRLNFHIQKIMQNSPIYFPNINAKNSFIHAEDAALFLAYLIKNEILGPINCSSKTPLSLKELVQTIEKITNSQAKICNEENEKNSSPYGDKNDFYADVSKLSKLNFKCKEIKEWLPELILSESKKYTDPS